MLSRAKPRDNQERGEWPQSIWPAKIERDVIARGIFTSVADLKRKLMRYIGIRPTESLRISALQSTSPLKGQAMTRSVRDTTAFWTFVFGAIVVGIVIWGVSKLSLEPTAIMWIAVWLLVLILLTVAQSQFFLAEILRVLEENSASKDA